MLLMIRASGSSIYFNAFTDRTVTDQLKDMKRTVFFLFALTVGFTISSAANLFDLLYWDLGDASKVEKRDESTQSLSEQTCACNGSWCKCCVDFNMTYIDLGGPGCVGMNYMSQDEGISVNVSYGQNLLHSQNVKPPNPEPICMSLLINLVEVCARFNNLEPSNDGLKGCLVLESKVFGDTQTQFDIGCFQSENSSLIVLPHNGTSENVTQYTNETQEFNEEEIMAAVNETAEQGLVFFGNLLGLTFGKPEVNTTTNANIPTDTNTNTESSTVTPQVSRNNRALELSTK